MNTIYVYTTETYRDFRNWRKIGQTHQESAKMRVDQQDGTSNPEPLIIEEIFQVEDWISDHTIHAELVRMGKIRVRMDKDREWFECSVDDVASAINNIKFGISRPNSYSMRPEQQQGCDLLVDLYNKGFQKGLLNAKMRYGKCFTFYQFTKAIHAERILILTYKPAVDASWYEDLKTHVDFDGWEYYHGREFSNKNPFKFPKYKGKPQILFASFQDLIKNQKTAKWKNLSNYKFQAGARDEDHFGTGTDKAKSVMSGINCKFWAHLSGTPLKTLMSGEFLDEEIYTWGYADEQKKRRAEKKKNWETEIYRWLPEMQFHTFKVSEEAKKLTRCYDNEEGFTMTKMFGSEDSETFIDDSAVKLFLDQMFGIGVHKSKSPVRTHAVDHMLFVMPPNVASATAMSKLLQKRVGKDYKIINVSGDNVKSLDKVKQYIQRNQKSITVTCGRFNTGVTVPEWDMVVMLDDTRAPETYFQTIFRCQSPDKAREKELCSVVDFNPQRCLEMIYEFADITAKPEQSTQDAVREFLDFAPVLDHSDNKPKKVNVDTILNLIAETGGYAERFGSQFMMNWALLDDVADKFFGIDAENTNKKTDMLGDEDLERGKNYDNNGSKTQAEIDAERKAAKELRQKVMTMMRRLPTYLFLEEKKIDSVTDILYYKNEELFSKTVGLSMDDFKELCSGFIKTDRLDRCIMAYNQIESV